MKYRNVTRALAFASALTAATVATATYASNSSESAASSVYVIDTISIPGHAKSVLASARTARLAIFDGQSDAALDLVTKARAGFEKNIAKYAIKFSDNSGYGIPIDNSISFAEGFKPDAKKAEVIASAGKLAKKGDADAAFKVMIDADIDLNFQYAFLPVSKTVSKLDEAYTQLKNKNYYEANLALKAVETSVVVEDFNASASPQQGYAWESIIK